MATLMSLFQSAVESIIPLTVLLGLLIFVHEMGHFLVAKYFKVRVEVFSLGFGPKLLKYKKGDTVYALSAIPLGGYVKMFGDDPTATIDNDQRAHSFTHKPVGQRIAVVLAGPIMNFLFAILIFMAVALLGEQAIAPKTGDIAEDSVAYAQGFRSGDTIKTVGGEKVTAWDEVQSKIQASGDRTIAVEIQRGDQTQTLQVTPKMADNKNPLNWDRVVGEVKGLTYQSRSTFVGVRDPKSLAGAAGLKTGDHIKKINGVEITKWRELREQLPIAMATGEVKIEAERGLLDKETSDNPQAISATMKTNAAQASSAEAALSALGLEFPELYLAGTDKDSPAAKAGLQFGDRVVSIDGQKVTAFDQVSAAIRAYGDRHTKDAADSAPAPLNFVISREGEEKTFALAPNAKDSMNSQGQEERRFQIGISALAIEALPTTVILDYKNPFAAAARGVEQTMKWTSLTVLSFVRLFQGEVSTKNVGGFFSIGAMAKKSWQIGAPQFLHVMAIISINLFVLNLLPVPVLDGGHLVFYTIEAIKGAPLSMRKMEIAQQVGLVLLLGLMVFALFNDATRMFFN